MEEWIPKCCDVITSIPRDGYSMLTTAKYNYLLVDVAEGGKRTYPEKYLRNQIEIDKSEPTCGAWESIPNDDRYANLTPDL